MITDAEIGAAARAVRRRLERVLEYHIPSESAEHMEVSKTQAWREREWARKQIGRSATAPTSPRRNYLDQDPGVCDGCGGDLSYEIHGRWTFSRTVNKAVDEPVIRGTEVLIRCDKCGLVGVPCGSPSVKESR